MPGSNPKPEEAAQTGSGVSPSEDDELFRMAIEHATDLIYLHDLEARSVYANASVRRLLGIEPESRFGPIHPDDVERGREWWRRVLDGGRDPIEWRVCDRDGGWRWFETCGSLVQYRQKPHVLSVCREISDRKRAEELSRTREEQLRLVNDAIPVMAWTVRPDGVVDFLNRRWTEYSGLTLEQYAADPAGPIHPDDLQRVMERWGHQLQSGEAYDDEMRLRRADGTYRWFLVRTAPVLDEHGQVVKWCGVSTDIEDRKQAEEEVRERERLLYQVVNALPVGVIVMDVRGDVLICNPESRRIWGGMIINGAERYARYRAWWHGTGKRVEPDQWASARAIAGGQTCSNELVDIETFDGRKRTIQNSAAPIRNGDGLIVGAVVANQDVTERVRAEAALRESERRLNESQRIAHLGHWEQDLTSGCITVSDEAYRIFGLPPGKGMRTLAGWNEYIHPEDRSIREAAIEQAMRDGTRYQTEYRVVRPTGEVRIVRSQGEVECDDSGKPRRLFGILQDLTERRRLEEQFRQAQKMEAIGQLAGGVAHDFNNLLTIISGYSELLFPGLPAGDSRREMVSQIREAGQRASDLTRQLLAFSRQTVLAPKVLDLNDLVRESEKMLCRLIGEDVELVTNLAPGLASVKADPGQISQVVMNLAVNARDAMPIGGRLSIETGNVVLKETPAVAPDARAGHFVVLTVSDTGTGMTPDVRAHIFEPYFTTKPSGKGTGLGLATVYGIIQQSGGFISVASEPGCGTTFKVHFPAVAERAPAAKPHSGLEALARGTETILLVEDEDVVRSMVQFVLQQAGYTVMAASRGGEALRIAAEEAVPISLLITDVVMPEMGGRELVEHLAGVRPEIKVLYLSGYTDDAVVRHGVLRAEAAFLQKPFTMVSLTNKVREVLDTSV